MWSFLILVLLDVPHSYEEESINLKSLRATNLSEIQQGPTTSNPILDSGPYHVPPLSTVCPMPKPFLHHHHYSTIQTDIVYNPNPCARPPPTSEIQQGLTVYLIPECPHIIFPQFHLALPNPSMCVLRLFAYEDSNLH